MTAGKSIYLFDVDGTLTPARQNVSTEMWEFLKKLKEKVPIAVVGGSDFAKIVEQLGGDQNQLLSTFDYIFSENGLISYHGQKQLPAESINKALEKINYKMSSTFVSSKGNDKCESIGRSCSQAERDQFVAYETKEPVRLKFVEELRKRFETYNLTFSIGGQISIDIFPSGWDKHIGKGCSGDIHFRR
uniref:Phosphomannomutase n=1 Tax=Ditylenchus dipsaci TaxID=166011 RepID=A0A915DZG0_9BILA